MDPVAARGRESDWVCCWRSVIGAGAVVCSWGGASSSPQPGGRGACLTEESAADEVDLLDAAASGLWGSSPPDWAAGGGPSKLGGRGALSRLHAPQAMAATAHSPTTGGRGRRALRWGWRTLFRICHSIRCEWPRHGGSGRRAVPRPKTARGPVTHRGCTTRASAWARGDLSYRKCLLVPLSVTQFRSGLRLAGRRPAGTPAATTATTVSD